VSRLYLLRHAKSSWKDERLDDHDRPLAPRGKRASKAIGRYLRDHDIEPELVLCSSAKRARQTLERLGPAGVDARIERELYAAGAHDLLERLRAVPDGVASVMLVGHNPGMQQLALRLAGLDDKFPTAALAILDCDGWSGLERAELIDYVKPRDLDAPPS
jgi:phosphohistidine phosphatase